MPILAECWNSSEHAHSNLMLGTAVNMPIVAECWDSSEHANSS